MVVEGPSRWEGNIDIGSEKPVGLGDEQMLEWVDIINYNFED